MSILYTGNKENDLVNMIAAEVSVAGPRSARSTLKNKLLNNKMRAAIPHQLNILSAFNNQ